MENNQTTTTVVYFMAKTAEDSNPSKESNDHYNYCVDTMANVNVYRNKDLIINVRSSGRPMRIDGVGGKTVNMNQIGDHPLFGPGFYCPENDYNVLSRWRLNQQGFLVNFSKDNESIWVTR